jgi:hypothetical protein
MSSGYAGKSLIGDKFTIGSGWADFINADIDYVKVFNVALSASDATAQAAGSTFAVAPVMDYTFNDGPQESGVSNGDSIAGWKSREGKNYQFNQGTLANRPSWVANAQKGNPGIRFDGTNDGFEYNNKILNGNSGVVFLVGKNNNGSSLIADFFAQSSTSVAHKFFIVRSRQSTGYSGIVVSNSTVSTDATWVINRKKITNTTDLSLLVTHGNGSSFNIYFNSVKDSTLYSALFSQVYKWAGSSFFASTDLTKTSIGYSIISTTISFPVTGPIAEIIAYDGTKTPSEKDILAIERYLLNKYGIST